MLRENVLYKSHSVFLLEINYWSVQFGRSVASDSLRPHGPQHVRLPYPSPAPGAYSNSSPSSRWCHPAISSSVVLFSSCFQSNYWYLHLNWSFYNFCFLLYPKRKSLCCFVFMSLMCGFLVSHSWTWVNWVLDIFPGIFKYIKSVIVILFYCDGYCDGLVTSRFETTNEASNPVST